MRPHGLIAEEAVQEAFLALASQSEIPESPLAWLVRVARNYVFQQYRSNARRTRREQVYRPAGSWFQRDESLALDAQEAAEALSKLPNEQAEIVMMHLWGELSFAQIAETLGSSRSSVHRKYTAAMELLREKFSCSERDRNVT